MGLVLSVVNILALGFSVIYMGMLIYEYLPRVPDTSNADIVILGAGTAGCVLARRLKEKYPRKKILVLERGRDARDNENVFNIKNAAVAAYEKPYSEVLPTEVPRIVSLATMHGGGSSHNFALCVRGTLKFYSEWGKILDLTNEDFLNYFRKIEKYSGDLGENRYNSGMVDIGDLPLNGSISFSDVMRMMGNSLSFDIMYMQRTILQSASVFLNSGDLRTQGKFITDFMNVITTSKKVTIVKDYNATEGSCISEVPQLFFKEINGLRASSNTQYINREYMRLDQAGNGNSKFGLKSDAVVTKIVVDELDIASEVEWEINSQKRTTKINKGGKVILCMGAIRTPYLLLKSGIGNDKVGKGMINHYGPRIIFRVDNFENSGLNFSAGPVVFVPEKEDLTSRDWQIIVSGDQQLDTKFLSSVGVDAEKERREHPNSKFITLLLYLTKPRSRGKVELDDSGEINIKLNMFTDWIINNKEIINKNSDIYINVKAMKWLFEIALRLKQKLPTLEIVYPQEERLNEIFPEISEKYRCHCHEDDSSFIPPEITRPQLLKGEELVRECVFVADHYCSTCKVEDVVNSRDFSLIGYPNVHVADASVFPSISDGNLCYPVYTMAEIVADRL